VIEGDGAAVHAFQQPTASQGLDVATDRHIRDAEGSHEVGNSDGSGIVELVQDSRVTLAGEHLPLTLPDHGATTRSQVHLGSD